MASDRVYRLLGAADITATSSERNITLPSSGDAVIVTVGAGTGSVHFLWADSGTVSLPSFGTSTGTCSPGIPAGKSIEMPKDGDTLRVKVTDGDLTVLVQTVEAVREKSTTR